MDIVTANDFRRQVGEYLNRTYYAKEQFVITKSGKQIAALVPIIVLERLTQLEGQYQADDKDQEPIREQQWFCQQLSTEVNPG